MNEIVLTTNGKLSREALQQLCKILKEKFHCDSIRMETDPTIIGGFTLKYGGKLYDMSISNNFRRLKDFVCREEDR